jgi:hypothetical protein
MALFPKRLGGQKGSIYLQGSTTKLLDPYMWEAELQQNVVDATIKGERFKRYEPQHGEGRIRLQSFVPFPGDRSPLSHVLQNTLVTGAGGGIPIDFVLEIVDTLQMFVGQGYVIRTQLHVVRDGIVTDEMEIQIDGQPSIVN